MCNEYFLVRLDSVNVPVRHTYTNTTDEWYAPDGVKYVDESVIEEIKAQATEENRIGDNSVFQLLMNIYKQNEAIKSELADIRVMINGLNTP